MFVSHKIKPGLDTVLGFMYIPQVYLPYANAPLHSYRIVRVIIIVLFTGLCIVAGLLIKQNRDLKIALARFEKQQFLAPGDDVPPLSALTLSGRDLALDFAHYPKTVLLVFQPDCRACQETIPYWREIAIAGTRDGYPVYGITLGDSFKSGEFLASNGLILETFKEIDSRTKNAYKLSLTPLTIVIDTTGRIERIWSGTFTRETKPDVEGYFGISVADDMTRL
ncbi:hypothetical protein BH20ACI2_BH20ACI2_27300 [soil metagenome]